MRTRKADTWLRNTAYDAAATWDQDRQQCTRVLTDLVKHVDVAAAQETKFTLEACKDGWVQETLEEYFKRRQGTHTTHQRSREVTHREAIQVKIT